MIMKLRLSRFWLRRGHNRQRFDAKAAKLPRVGFPGSWASRCVACRYWTGLWLWRWFGGLVLVVWGILGGVTPRREP
jgi:hypothetical protein